MLSLTEFVEKNKGAKYVTNRYKTGGYFVIAAVNNKPI